MPLEILRQSRPGADFNTTYQNDADVKLPPALPFHLPFCTVVFVRRSLVDEGYIKLVFSESPLTSDAKASLRSPLHSHRQLVRLVLEREVRVNTEEREYEYEHHLLLMQDTDTGTFIPSNRRLHRLCVLSGWLDDLPTMVHKGAEQAMRVTHMARVEEDRQREYNAAFSQALGSAYPNPFTSPPPPCPCYNSTAFIGNGSQFPCEWTNVSLVSYTEQQQQQKQQQQDVRRIRMQQSSSSSSRSSSSSSSNSNSNSNSNRCSSSSSSALWLTRHFLGDLSPMVFPPQLQSPSRLFQSAPSQGAGGSCDCILVHRALEIARTGARAGEKTTAFFADVVSVGIDTPDLFTSSSSPLTVPTRPSLEVLPKLAAPLSSPAAPLPVPPQQRSSQHSLSDISSCTHSAPQIGVACTLLW